MKRKFQIVDYIVKSINGELSEPERNALNEWINTSSQNKILYDKLTSKKGLSQKVAQYSRLDIEKEYQSFELKMQHRQKVYTIKRFLSYAASLAAVAIFSVYIYISYINKPIDIKQATRNIEILPGGKKAILTLSDGSVINLSNIKGDSLWKKDGAVIQNAGSEVSYMNSINTTPARQVVFNTLKVPRGGEYKLTLSDGTQVWVNAETQLKFPVLFSGNERVVYLIGEAYFDVAKEAKRPFIVISQGSRVKVLGTQFNLKSYPEEARIVTTLVEGKVSFYSEKSHSEIQISPGEQSQIEKINGAISKNEVSTYMYTAWKDGRFVFKSARMEDLMNILSRWYNCKVVFRNNDIKNISFTGDILKSEDISKMLSIIEYNRLVKFEISGNIIYVDRQ